MSEAREARGVRARNLKTVGALAALYVVPLALAFYTYYGTGWRPASHVNHGTLIAPPRPLPEVSLPQVGGLAAHGGPAFRDQWTLVYVGSGECDGDCRQALLVMQQAQLALNVDMHRVVRVFLASSACCAAALREGADSGLRVLDAGGEPAAPLLAQFPPAGRAHSVFVVDPLGNLMMSYDARTDPRGLLLDLQKLLRLSHIG